MARGALIIAVLLAWAAPAAASQPILRERLIVPATADVSCSQRSHPGVGAAAVHLTARGGGYLTARLAAPSGDWDLAVLRRSGGGAVAASAYRGATEVASGFVRRGDRLTVRACRRSGRARMARISVSLERISARSLRRRTSLVRVATSSASARRRLARMDLDLTENAGRGFVWVVLHGPRDAARLRSAGFAYTTAAAAARPIARAAALPSGRSGTYRRLADYGNEMKALAAANPDFVRLFTLGHTSREGRPVEGLEITTNPGARDGKPVYLQLGMHHANEWPAAEHPLEWAYELVGGYRAGDARTRSLVSRVRTIIVPVVNPDGFNFSREAGEADGHGDGLGAAESATAAEGHRKNCSAAGCVSDQGVDLNRNYGDLWGGVGSSSSPTSSNHRGSAPFSEPEAQNIRELISRQQVVMMITNHTAGNLILRQPGTSSQPATPDETLYKAVGAQMAAENGYSNVFSYQIGYDHVGTTDGWSYYTTGGLGYVFEIGNTNSHPPYAQVVQNYDGSAVPGGGNREAYYVAMESAANAAHHAVLTGGAPTGSILRLTKSFTNRTSIGPPTQERFDTTIEVPAAGSFEWHVNQSSRPLMPGERWTLTCERPEGVVQATQEVSIGRGQTQQLDLSACGGLPAGPDARPRPRIQLKLVAGFRDRLYRVRVTGRLRGVADFERCDGAVALAILARSQPVGKRRAGLDERCGFERRFRIPRRKLPRALRSRGARITLKAVARWGGNEFLAPAQRRVSGRVRRR